MLRKHLDALDGHACRQAYDKLQVHFGNGEMQACIATLKEEEYQAGFVNDLFVNVLGYTLKPQPDYDLVAELKNVRNAKKADGAILCDWEERVVRGGSCLTLCWCAGRCLRLTSPGWTASP